MNGSVVGVDTGGTFTDFVFLADDGTLTIRKRPSTPAQPERSVLDGLQDAQQAERLAAEFALVHGTTVATNALLERKGAKTALLVTAGHRDLLEIARQSRTNLYSFHPQKPPPLLSRADCYEVPERLDWQGRVLQPLDVATVETLLQQLKRDGYESLAVCLLFAYLNPAHEQHIGDRARNLGFVVSLSSEIAPEPREYERAVTVAANAFVAPVMRNYLGRLETGLARFPVRSFHVMQSNGGTMSAQEAGDFAIQTAVSGPAGGVNAAIRIGMQAGYRDVLTFDMGGTSTDVALIRNGACDMVTLSFVNDLPLSVPMCAIHTVGAGGGSLAWQDAAGGLRVGPRSAGADPGPVAYGKGTELTVTDSHVLLNHLPANLALAGTLPLDVPRVREHFAAFAARFGLTPTATARGIVDVANAAMARALRHVSVERGVDPAGFTLLSFGGAGGLHACQLAALLGMKTVLIPLYPGAFSALGLALSSTRRDWIQAFPALPCDGDVCSTLIPHFQKLSAKANEDRRKQENAPPAPQVWGESNPKAKQSTLTERAMHHELSSNGNGSPQTWGVRGAEPNSTYCTAEMRYRGQSFSLPVPISREELTAETLARDFHAAHRARYGYADEKEPTEIVALRLTVISAQNRPLPRSVLPTENGRPFDTQLVQWDEGELPTALYRRETLPAGQEISASAIVVQMDATTLIPPGWSGRVDTWGNLILTRT